MRSVCNSSRGNVYHGHHTNSIGRAFVVLLVFTSHVFTGTKRGNEVGDGNAPCSAAQ